MNRRSFLVSGSGAGAALTAGITTPAYPASKAIPKPERILFWDLARLDYWDNLELCQGEPERQPEASYLDPFEEGKRGGNFPVVWRDPNSSSWRMVYSVKWSPYTLMMARSEDGYHWTPHPVPEATPPGEKLAPNHLHTIAGSGAGGVFIDFAAQDGFPFKVWARQHSDETYVRALEDPDHHWHELARREGKKRYMTQGITHVSEDGIHWKEEPAYAWDFPGWRPEPPLFVYRHRRQNRYGMVVRPGWGDRRQCIRFTEGDDFSRWSDPELLFQPDTLDTDGPIGLYGMPVFPCGSGYVGLLWVFHNSSSRPVKSYNQFFGTMDCQLAFSHDGVRFFRGLRRPFLRLEDGLAQLRPSCLVETDEEIRIYSEAARAPHGLERSLQRQFDEPLKTIELHTLRRDGYMYLRSRGDWARFQTKPLTLFLPELTVNSDARYGEVRVQVTDEKSEPLEGFSFADCIPLRHEDALAHPLRWKEASLDKILGQVVRLEVEIRNANLYSFTASHHFLDAQDQWLLKDGKPIQTRLPF